MLVVIPVRKGGKGNCDKRGPVSLTSVVLKAYEMVICGRIVIYLGANRTTKVDQLGLRQKFVFHQLDLQSNK